MNINLEYTRQCDMCKEFKTCDMTYFTERYWFCKTCLVLDIAQNTRSCDDSPYASLESDDDYWMPGALDAGSKFEKDIYLVGTKEDLIDISRTIGVALSVGHAEAPLDKRKIIVKVIK